jgi:ubiquinol-cytochrome c reductase cytochrome b subunit
VYYGVLWTSGGNDVIASTFHISLNATTWIFRVAIVTGPFLAYVVTRWICLGLQARDRHTVEHGVETGVIVRGPDGGFTEVERPATEEDKARLAPSAPLAPPALPPASNGDVPPPAGHRIREALHRAWNSR